MNVEQYFNLIYHSILIATGIIAFLVLVLAGIMHLTSAGDPKKINEAKKRILAAFIGIIILLATYLILNTINPELTKISLPKLETPDIPAYSQGKTTKSPNILIRIKEIANDSVVAINKIDSLADRLTSAVSNCSCDKVQSLCACEGQRENSSCKPVKCYASSLKEPCPDSAEIKNSQMNIVAWKNELVYYKNRALKERGDLTARVKDISNEINYYQELKKEEKSPEVIKYYDKEISELNEEIKLLNELSTELLSFSQIVEQIEIPGQELGKLPNQCLSNIETACSAKCSGDCFDTHTGCQPSACGGGNPCPTEAINENAGKAKGLKQPIKENSNRILQKVEEIIKFKTITI